MLLKMLVEDAAKDAAKDAAGILDPAGVRVLDNCSHHPCDHAAKSGTVSAFNVHF